MDLSQLYESLAERILIHAHRDYVNSMRMFIACEKMDNNIGKTITIPLIIGTGNKPDVG